MSVFGDTVDEDERAPLTEDTWLTPTEETCTPIDSQTLTLSQPSRRVTYGTVDIAPSPPAWHDNPVSVTTPSSPNEIQYAQERRSATPQIRKRTAQQPVKAQKRGGPIGWLMGKKFKKQDSPAKSPRSRTGPGTGIGDRGVPTVERRYSKSVPTIPGSEPDIDPELQYQQQKEMLAARGFPNTSPMVVGTRDFKLYSEYVKKK